MPTTYDRELIEVLRAEAAEAQAAFWDALLALETELGVELEIDNDDLSNHDVDSLIALAEDTDEEEECGKCVTCGAQCVSGGEGSVICPVCEPEVIHTSCEHCGQDIEGSSPFPEGEWRDRGNNTHCPNDSGKLHAPYIAKGEI